MQEKTEVNISAAEFLDMLYGGVSEGWLTVWHKKTKRTKWFHIKDRAKAAKYATAKAHDERNADEIYYGVCLRKERRDESVRGDLEDISVMPGLWWDIDVAEEDNVHAQSNLPKGFNEAIDFVKGILPAPSIIIHSGHGLHAYWLFDKPVIITDGNRKQYAELSEGWQRYLNDEGTKRGWKGDNTSDLPRILRLPGTVNRKKGGEIEVKVIECNGARYPVSEFVKQNAAEKAVSVTTTKAEPDTMDFSSIMTGGAEWLSDCRFMQYCKMHAATLTEPEWYACISNLALCKDGDTLCHKISKPHPDYRQKETADKITHAQKVKKPVTCAYIRESLRFDCSDCKHSVKAPIALTVISKDEQVKETLSVLPQDIKAVYAAEYLSALCYAKTHLPAEYAVVKSELKDKLKLNLNDLEKAIKALGQQAARPLGVEERMQFDGLDTLYIIPQGYYVTAERGIERHTRDGTAAVIFNPIVIAERIRNIDTTTERLRLKFLRSGQWYTVTENRSTVFNRNGIVKLADYGLGVTSNNAGNVIQYLIDFEAANDTVIPTKNVVSKIGWRGLEFLPLTDGGIAFEADDSAGGDIASGLFANGSMEVWLKAANTVRRASPFGRFLFSASFASPLLKLLDLRTFMLFIWCESGYGKSASIKAGLSAWGNPNKLQGTFNTTQAGLERKCAALNNLPYVIEERQLLNEKRLDPAMVMYMFADERSKQKAERSGNLADTLHWKNIVISGGEQPVTGAKFQDGAQNRVLEICGKPLSSYIEAGTIHETTNVNYGHAGRLFITGLIDKLKIGYDIKAEFRRMADAVQKEYGSGAAHLNNVAAVALGDYLASTIVFNEDAETAWQGAVQTAVEILKDNEGGRLDTAAVRGYDFIRDWLMKNMAKFDGTSYGDRYGVYEEGKLRQDGTKSPGTFYVYPTILDNALLEQGFSPEQVFTDMVAKGKIITEKAVRILKSGSKEYLVHKTHHRIGGENPRVYGIPMAEKEVRLVQCTMEEAGELPF